MVFFHGWILTDNQFYKYCNRRWAPAKLLRGFLFPEFKLSENPSAEAYAPIENVYLHDPAMDYSLASQMKDMDEAQVVQIADKMLQQLADWRPKPDGEEHLKYYSSPGRGGSVTTWIKAAENYHHARLEHYLNKGTIVSMLTSDEDLAQHGLPFYRRLNQVRSLLDIQNEASSIKCLSHPRPHPDVHTYGYTSDDQLQYAADVNSVASYNNERSVRIKIFNKIMRESCMGCPLSSMLFYPIGIEGLVKHMRNDHPSRFWGSDSWSIVG